jgi:hypothetical protein
MQVANRNKRRERDRFDSNRDLVPGLMWSHDPAPKSSATFRDHVAFDVVIEAHRDGSTTVIVRSVAIGIRVACIHPGRGRAHASSEQSSSRAVVTDFAR